MEKERTQLKIDLEDMTANFDEVVKEKVGS